MAVQVARARPKRIQQCHMHLPGASLASHAHEEYWGTTGMPSDGPSRAEHLARGLGSSSSR